MVVKTIRFSLCEEELVKDGRGVLASHLWLWLGTLGQYHVHVPEDEGQGFSVHDETEGDALGVVGLRIDEDVGVFLDDGAGRPRCDANVPAFKGALDIGRVEWPANQDVGVPIGSAANPQHSEMDWEPEFLNRRSTPL